MQKKQKKNTSKETTAPAKKGSGFSGIKPEKRVKTKVSPEKRDKSYKNQSADKPKRKNSYNVFQHELSAYFREEGIDWKKTSKKKNFAALAAKVWKTIPQEIQSNPRILAVNIDNIYRDANRKPSDETEIGVSRDRDNDLKNIVYAYGDFSWWEFDGIMNDLLTSKFFHPEWGDKVDFDGAGVVGGYNGINSVFSGESAMAVSSIWKGLKDKFNVKKNKKSQYSGVRVILDDIETEKLSKGNSITVVFRLLMDKETYSSISGLPEDIIPERENIPVAEIVSEEDLLAELKESREQQQDELKKLELQLKADREKTKKLKEEVKLEKEKTKQQKIKSTAKLKVSSEKEKAKSRERLAIKKASIRSLEKQFEKKLITKKEYFAALKNLNK